MVQETNLTHTLCHLVSNTHFFYKNFFIATKKPNASQHSLTGPTKNPLHICKETSGKMCGHTPTGYISLVLCSKFLFNLVGL